MSVDHVERVLDVGVKMPGHLLGRGNLEFRDAETRSSGMFGPALDFVEITAILHRFHNVLHLRSDPLSVESAPLHCPP
jgi:hypothetical protein